MGRYMYALFFTHTQIYTHIYIYIHIPFYDVYIGACVFFQHTRTSQGEPSFRRFCGGGFSLKPYPYSLYRFSDSSILGTFTKCLVFHHVSHGRLLRTVARKGAWNEPKASRGFEFLTLEIWTCLTKGISICS